MDRPEMKSVKFLSYNSTYTNPVKTQCVRDLMDACAASYCGVQKHFKKIKTIKIYFKSEFPKFDSLVHPAHREEGQDSSRAQGSLVQLSLKSLKRCEKRADVDQWLEDTGSDPPLWRIETPVD